MVLLEFLGFSSSGNFFMTLLLNACAIFAAAYLLKGVHVKDFTSALILAILLALLNSTLGAVLGFITKPITWITLGLFSLVVDAFVLMVADHFMDRFKMDNFSWAIGFAAVLAIFNALLSFIFL